MSNTQAIMNMSVWELAELAGTLDPDSDTSPGALFLEAARDAAVELIKEGDLVNWEDRVPEQADGIPSVYVYGRWMQFTDLAAWREEPVSGEWPEDLTDAAGVALYQIAERLILVLVQEWIDQHEDEEDED